jgi:hypothetical protein
MRPTQKIFILVGGLLVGGLDLTLHAHTLFLVVHLFSCQMYKRQVVEPLTGRGSPANAYVLSVIMDLFSAYF